jgi:50S ribosomal protein L16 3-hydroxylase
MRIDLATPLLGGLSPQRFMRRHWQREPLVVRGAWPDAKPPLERAGLFALVAREDVESRLVVQEDGERWRLRRGPFARRALPSPARAGWTLLVQGLDLHVEAAHELLARFRFVPDARLDDLMLSWASDGGGVGPHVDSYDVFLLQVQGVRRWRIGRVRDATLRDDVPLAMLRGFAPEAEWRLAAGDLLYLPPGWAHEGVAEGECMTCSIGFRAPRRERLGREVLQALLDDEPDAADEPLYADRAQHATLAPGRIPHGLQAFAQDAVRRVIARPHAVERALGEVLSEPKPGVVFERREARLDTGAALRLDRRTRMMYDTQHVYLNGESYRAAGGDARLMRRLADERRLALRDLRRLSEEARALVGEWLAAGWLQAADEAGEGEA